MVAAANFCFCFTFVLNFGREGGLGLITLCPITQNIQNYDKLQQQ